MLTTKRSLSPIEAAFQAWLANIGQLGESPVIIIEGGYFDCRELSPRERARQLEDSFQLLSLLREQQPRSCKKILLTALWNDFGANKSYCGIEPHAEGSETQVATCGESPVPPWARQVFARNAAAIEEFPLEIFPMKPTRNRSARAIAEGLKGSQGPDRRLREMHNADAVDIYADTEAGSVYVACRKKGPLGLAVRCTALMAQHYFDLYRYARKSVPSMTDLWIFDFNQYLEEERVRLGAEVSLVLYPWPSVLSLRVVNCVYYPWDQPSRPIRITAWP